MKKLLLILITIFITTNVMDEYMPQFMNFLKKIYNKF